MKEIWIQGGSFLMGSPKEIGFSGDYERPQEIVHVEGFYIDQTTVTNQDFAAFVAETNYVTEAERFGDSFVFHLLLNECDKDDATPVDNSPWWLSVKGASWRHPFGLHSSYTNYLDHPVVHVSRNDALAYCRWSGKQLPTEAQWEYACAGGENHRIYPWGNELEENDEHHANVWQGSFPYENTGTDGYIGTAPVLSYQPNGYDLYQMIGNVWEWCSNPAKIPLVDFKKYGEQDFSDMLIQPEQIYAIRGGSFLCHESYCNRYRTAARNGNLGNSTSSNLGFRCVRNVSKNHTTKKVETLNTEKVINTCCSVGRDEI